MLSGSLSFFLYHFTNWDPQLCFLQQACPCHPLLPGVLLVKGLSEWNCDAQGAEKRSSQWHVPSWCWQCYLVYVSKIFGGFLNFSFLKESLEVCWWQSRSLQMCITGLRRWKTSENRLGSVYFSNWTAQPTSQNIRGLKDGLDFLFFTPEHVNKSLLCPPQKSTQLLTLTCLFDSHLPRTISSDNILFWLPLHLEDSFCKLPREPHPWIYHNLSLKHSTKFQDSWRPTSHTQGSPSV